MRRIAQPGPAPAERLIALRSRGRRVAFELPAGRPLLDAVREAFAGEGFESGVLRLSGGRLDPLAYVMPALSPTPRHAAFYSQTHRPPGGGRIVAGALTFGRRDGASFFHCHALWEEADGRIHGGHILPEETGIGEALRVEGAGLADAVFEASPDPETNLPLLAPRPLGTAPGEGPFHVLRLRPNQDLAGALEAYCAGAGMAGATLHGGVGSIIGARFEDGGTVEPFATEMFVAEGRIGPGGARIDAGLVDLTGAVARGRLVRGDNPVLMTLEVVVEEERGGP